MGQVSSIWPARLTIETNCVLREDPVNFFEFLFATFEELIVSSNVYRGEQRPEQRLVILAL